MPPPQPQRPLLVYLDVNVLVFWILPQSHLPGRRAHHANSREEVVKLFDVFKKHAGPASNIQVVTCQWSLMEAHSVLYLDTLWKNNLAPSKQGKKSWYDLRKEIFPVSYTHLTLPTILLV